MKVLYSGSNYKSSWIGTQVTSPLWILLEHYFEHDFEYCLNTTFVSAQNASISISNSKSCYDSFYWPFNTENHKIAIVKDTIIDDIPVWHVEIDAIDDLEASEDTIEEVDEFLAFLPTMAELISGIKNHHIQNKFWHLKFGEESLHSALPCCDNPPTKRWFAFWTSLNIKILDISSIFH